MAPIVHPPASYRREFESSASCSAEHPPSESMDASGVELALREMTAARNDLGNRIKQLRERLAGVLSSPHAANNPAVASPREHGSPLAMTIRATSMLLHEIDAVVADVLERLDI